MADFITERDPIIVHVEIPNFHGKSLEFIAAQKNVDATYKEYLNFIDECEVTGNFDQVKVGEKFNKCLQAERIKDDLYNKMVSIKEAKL
jgi:CO dehydrogenase/acetyl-CoA synthase beta subunit